MNEAHVSYIVEGSLSCDSCALNWYDIRYEEQRRRSINTGWFLLTAVLTTSYRRALQIYYSVQLDCGFCGYTTCASGKTSIFSLAYIEDPLTGFIEMDRSS